MPRGQRCRIAGRFFRNGMIWALTLKVIAKQIKLRDLLVGPVNALETGQRYWLALDVEYQVALGLFETQKLLNGDRRALFCGRAFYGRLLLRGCFWLCHGSTLGA